MVNVKVLKKEDLIKSLSISGHANAGDYGNDLVCAGVSSISIGLANALDKLTQNLCTINIDENLVSIEVLDSDVSIQMILQTGIIQLQTIEEQFPKNIKIKIMEV